MLLPDLAATASDLQLPEERRPPDCSWGRARKVAAALAAMSAAPGADTVLAESGSLPRLLELAAQLATHAPAEEVRGNVCSILFLLGTAASLQRSVPPHQQHEMTAQQSAQLAQQLLPALPKFAPVLSSDAPHPTMLLSLARLADLLVELAPPAASLGCSSLVPVRAWCVGATAAVRLLAPVSTLRASTAGQLPDAAIERAAAADDASEGLCVLSEAVTDLIVKASSAAARLNSLLGTAETAEAAAAAHEAAWQLHSALCRAVHAGAGACRRRALVQAASGVLSAADYLSVVADSTAPASALGAAHFELLQTVLLGPAEAAAGLFGRVEAFIDATMGLSIAVRCGPAAIAAHPDTEAMFARLAAGLSVSASCCR